MTHITLSSSPSMNCAPRRMLVRTLNINSVEIKNLITPQEPSTPTDKRTQVNNDYLINAPKKPAISKMQNSNEPTVSCFLSFE